jgi:hypothetical protein
MDGLPIAEGCKLLMDGRESEYCERQSRSLSRELKVDEPLAMGCEYGRRDEDEAVGPDDTLLPIMLVDAQVQWFRPIRSRRERLRATSCDI